MPQEQSTIIIAEIAGQKPIGSAASLRSATSGWNLVYVTGVTQAIEAMNSSPNARIFVSNEPDQHLFEMARKNASQLITILVTDLPMAKYCESLGQRDLELIDHVIANLDPEWTNTDFATTIQKIIRADLFGIDKYLSPTSHIESRVIKSSRDRDPTNKFVHDWVDACGLGKNIARLAYGICEELLMNAIYDAPVAGGRKHYEEMERTAERVLAPDEWATLKFGADSKMLAISITDPFGAFLKDRWFTYLRKALKRNDSDALIDSKKGGAGLGLFKMLYSSHSVVCNVDPGKFTEVIIIIAINHPVRDFMHTPRSIHYFNTSSHS